jgi:hypothetical protein
MSVDMEDQPESDYGQDYGLDSEDDSSVLFHIPEEILDGSPDSGSDSGQDCHGCIYFIDLSGFIRIYLMKVSSPSPYH